VGANSELSDFQSAVRTALGEHWKWFVFQGIVMLALGCLAVAEPVIASVAAGIYIGWLFLFSGLQHDRHRRAGFGFRHEDANPLYSL
jgi:uncharacterized membrane protein HdeD (DUF308 family)